MKYAVLPLILLLLVASCTKKEHCPAYDSPVLYGWFPYAEGDTYYFTDEMGGRDTLQIAHTERSDPHDAKYSNNRLPLFSRWHQECNVHGLISTEGYSDRPHQLQMKLIEMQQSPTEYSPYFWLVFQGFDVEMNISGDDPGDLTHYPSEPIYSMEQLDVVEMNGNTYHDVMIISTKNDAYARDYGMSKLWIAKGKGVIGYRTYPDDVLHWME